MRLIRFADAPRYENVQGRHRLHSAPELGSDEIVIGRTTKEPGPCEPFFHKRDHEDIILMLRGSFIIRVGNEDVTLNAGDTLIIPPHTVHSPIAAGPEGCELVGMSVASVRIFDPAGKERDWLPRGTQKD